MEMKLTGIMNSTTLKPGETTRFWVVAAGPTNNVNFHVVGTIFDRAWVNSDLTSPPQQGVQTVLEHLWAETDITMALAGLSSVRELDESVLAEA